MKKTKNNAPAKKNKSVKFEESKNTEVTDKTVPSCTVDDDEKGFGGWLRSPDGMETMKLFVIANSIVMLTTITFPHIQTVFQIIYDVIYGPDSFF